jgi:hypothetical protein
MKRRKARRWTDVKVHLLRHDQTGLLGVIRDLYNASAANRRHLHARFAAAASVHDEYRFLVREAVFPDPLTRRAVRLRDANAAIAEFKRATDDVGGTVDLMLEFVEAGTEQAADLGYGDDAYFAALERKLDEVVRSLDALSEEDRAKAAARLIRLGEHRASIGWGYGDFLGDVSSKVQADEASRTIPVLPRSRTRPGRRRTQRNAGVRGSAQSVRPRGGEGRSV